MTNLFSDLSLLFQRINWLNILDIILVTAIFFVILQMINDTKAAVILRGVIILAILLSISNFSGQSASVQLVDQSNPAGIITGCTGHLCTRDPSRALESIGRAGSVISLNKKTSSFEMQNTIRAVVTAASRLSTKNHGALIILQRIDNLKEYILTGVQLNARTTPELLLQVFYPNTPASRWSSHHCGERAGGRRLCITIIRQWNFE